MISSKIEKIAYYLPEQVLTNEELARLYPGWSADRIFEKTGINSRHVSGPDETAGDLGEKAARELFVEHAIDPATIDFVLLATQSPDYLLPTTACMLQSRLGIPMTAGALDFNLGCSAYIYGLSLAKGLIASETARSVLLIMAETYTKHIHPMDKSVRTIFGDGAAATLVTAAESAGIGQFVLGTDGQGFDKLIVPAGGSRLCPSPETARESTDDSGNMRSRNHLFMDGPEIFNFTISTIPDTVRGALVKNNLSLDDIDLFVFHQANRYILDFLRKKCNIQHEKFYMNFSDCGNTVSASIPIALARAIRDGSLKPGMRVMLVGFGVGLSWGATILTW
jgi:3-oxoacyl-[acyl-carrier-protein] synthase-3